MSSPPAGSIRPDCATSTGPATFSLYRRFPIEAALDGTLTVVGEHPGLPADVVAAGRLDPAGLRNFYGACDVLVVPSVSTRRFIEPWGLVVNEAMNQGVAIIASNAVG